jgi:hypothetical protein
LLERPSKADSTRPNTRSSFSHSMRHLTVGPRAATVRRQNPKDQQAIQVISCEPLDPLQVGHPRARRLSDQYRTEASDAPGLALYGGLVPVRARVRAALPTGRRNGPSCTRSRVQCVDSSTGLDAHQAPASPRRDARYIGRMPALLCCPSLAPPARGGVENIGDSTRRINSKQIRGHIGTLRKLGVSDSAHGHLPPSPKTRGSVSQEKSFPIPSLQRGFSFRWGSAEPRLGGHGPQAREKRIPNLALGWVPCGFRPKGNLLLIFSSTYIGRCPVSGSRRRGRSRT